MFNWLVDSVGYYLCFALILVAILLPPAVLGWAGAQLLPFGGMIVGILLGFTLSMPAVMHWSLACQAFRHIFATVPFIPLRRKPSADELGWQRYFTAFLFLPFHVTVYAALLWTTSPNQLEGWVSNAPLGRLVHNWLRPSEAQIESLGSWSGGMDKSALFNITFWDGYWPAHLGLLVCLAWSTVVLFRLTAETIRRWRVGPGPLDLNIDQNQHPDDLDLCEAVGEPTPLARVLYLVPPWLLFSPRRAARITWGEPMWILSAGAILGLCGIWFSGTLLIGAALRFEGAVQSQLRKRSEQFSVASKVSRWLLLQRRADHYNAWIAADVEAARQRRTEFAS